MTREQVIEWAEKLAICSSASHKEFLHEGLFELVELVAAAEREACAKVCDVTPPYPFRPSIEAAHAIRARGQKEGV